MFQNPLLRLFILFSFVSLSFCDSEVEQLTDDDFDTEIKNHETALVMFYAPWCGHCKRLKPDFEKAGSILSKNDPPIALLKVDCTESGKAACNKHDVSAFPTLKIFRNGKVIKEYNGPRNADGMVKYMKSQVGPGSKQLNALSDFNTFTGKEEVVVVGFFKEDSDFKKTFSLVSDRLREKVTFGHSSADEVLADQKVKSEAVKLYRPKVLQNKFESGVVEFSGDASSSSAIEQWIKKSYHGLVGHRTSENTDDFPSPLVVAYYNVDYVKNPKGTNYWRNRIMKVAKQYEGKYTFAISAKDDFQHELNEFGFDYVPSEKPIIAVKGAEKQKYVMKDEFSIESFEKFLSDLVDNKISPYLKSEEVPSDNSAGVKVAVAKNFDELITDNGKDTLIEFYAPWCGHCKKLTPIFDELGEALKNEEVVIAKMDATANDVPAGFDVRGFPTLYWLPKNAKSSPVRYEGGRELDDFIKYISKHATDELKGYDRSGKAKSTSEKDEF